MNQEEVITFEDFQAACAGKSHAAMTEIAWVWLEEAHNMCGVFNEMTECYEATSDMLDYVIGFLEERNLLSEIDSKGFALYKTAIEENRAKMVKRAADGIRRHGAYSVKIARIEQGKAGRAIRAQRDPTTGFREEVYEIWKERRTKRGFNASELAREMHELSKEKARKQHGYHSSFVIQTSTFQEWFRKWKKEEEAKKTTVLALNS